MHNKQELLAPAGSMETLIYAVESGADAVYLGGSEFSARGSAKNFTNEQIVQAVDYCHLRNVNVYVAINILINDREFESLANYIEFINNIGVDAVIVQDIGVAKLVREIAPNMPLHGSTQMTIYDLNGAKLAKELGFKRVVLARELSMDAIKQICNGIDIDVEVFVHGALCVSYSGQCLMSSIIGGRSGNRGRCAQPCRLMYNIENSKGFLLSPKDLCLVNYLKELNDIGVKSLKIEGRMRGPQYVGTVVSIYRKYLDNKSKVTHEDYKKLEQVFYRGGFTDGYFLNKKGKEMFCYDKPDNPYKMQNEVFELKDNSKKTKITIKCTISINNPIKLEITDENDRKIIYIGKIPAEKAINKTLTEQRVEEQLRKLGGTVFEIQDLKIIIDNDISLPVSEINNSRRNAISMLEGEIINSFKRSDVKQDNIIKQINSKPKKTELTVQVSNVKQLQAIRQINCHFIYIPLEIVQEIQQINDMEIVILPRISPEHLEEILKKYNIKRAMATNIGQIYLLNKLGIEIYIDHTLNIFNSYSAKQLEQLRVKLITLSTELMLLQIKNIYSDIPFETVVYGRLPLMITENCIVENCHICSKGGVIVDRIGEHFPIRCLEGCRNEILNSKPIVMSDKLDQIENSGVTYERLIFTIESAQMCIEIYNAYKNKTPLNIDFTRGKFYKGV